MIKRAIIIAASIIADARASPVDPAKFRREYRAAIPTCNASARKWIRMAFHDAGSFNGPNSGADGSLQFELDRIENHDFKDEIDFYSKFLSRNVSMADSIAFGGKLAVEVCRGPRIKWRYGRIDASGPNAPNMLPNPHISAAETRKAFVDRMGFTVRQTVALVGGAHSVSLVRDAEVLPIGSDPSFTDLTPDTLDTKFLQDLLVNANSAASGLARIPSDANMANDPLMRAQVRELANDPRLFCAEFKRAFEKTILLGARFHGKDYSHSAEGSPATQDNSNDSTDSQMADTRPKDDNQSDLVSGASSKAICALASGFVFAVSLLV